MNDYDQIQREREQRDRMENQNKILERLYGTDHYDDYVKSIQVSHETLDKEKINVDTKKTI